MSFSSCNTSNNLMEHDLQWLQVEWSNKMFAYLSWARYCSLLFSTLVNPTKGGLNFVQQIVSEKSIKCDPGVRLCNIWNQSAHGLVWICNSTHFSPPKSNHSLSITLCSHLGLQACQLEILPFKKHHVVLSLRCCTKRKCWIVKRAWTAYKQIAHVVGYVKYLQIEENNMLFFFP